MTVHHIHTFLVHPGKGTGKYQIVGTTVSLTGGMFALLDGIYSKSDIECDVDITFSPTPDGTQQNDCRDLITAYLNKPDLPKGRKIAERLAMHTDGRSGLGLLFLIAGKIGREHKILLPIKKYLGSAAKREFHQILPLRARISLEFIRTLESIDRWN